MWLFRSACEDTRDGNGQDGEARKLHWTQLYCREWRSGGKKTIYGKYWQFKAFGEKLLLVCTFRLEMFAVKTKVTYDNRFLSYKCKFTIIFAICCFTVTKRYLKQMNGKLEIWIYKLFQVHASMAVFWYLDDIVLDWIGQTGPGQGAKVIETRGKVKKHLLRVE